MERKADTQNVVFTWKMFLLCFAFPIGMSPLLLYKWYQMQQRKAVKQQHAFTTATVTQLVYHSERTGIWYNVQANYQLNGASYTRTGKAIIGLRPDQRDSLIGVWLPVIYEKENPSNSYLLASERAFNRFELDLPDSLIWTKLYFTD